MRSTVPVASPCNSVCRIDERTGWCAGCYRTLDEIADWAALSEAQKQRVRDALRDRRRASRRKAAASEAGP